MKQSSAPVSLEEKLGARVFVWIGGIALVFAVGFLVKFSFDSGLLSPSVRISLGTLFGIALIGGAEFMRKRSDRIAQALCGAGIADLFACLLAAVNLYDLITSKTVGFSLMAVLTALAVGLSLRHGPFVALLGLVGGFVTPALIGADESTGPLFAYLILLEIGLVVVTRRRNWASLSLLTLIGSLAWALLYAIFRLEAIGSVGLGAFVLASAAVYVLSATRFADDEPAGAGLSPIRLALGATVSAIVLLSLLTATGGFTLTEFGMLGLLGLGCIVLARIDKRYLAMPWLGMGASAVMLLAYVLRFRYLNGDEPLPVVEFVWLTVGFGLLYVLGAYLCLWRSQREAIWAWMSSIAVVVVMFVAWSGVQSDVPEWFRWWMPAAALTTLMALLTVPVWRVRARTPGAEAAIDALSLGAAALLTLTGWLAFEHPWIAVAWAGFGLVTALIIEWQKIAGLRWALCWLSTGAALLLIVPGPFVSELGETIVFNKLLGEYGLPALAFALIAWRMRRADQPMLAAAHDVGAALATLALITLQVRHGFHPGDFEFDLDRQFTNYEVGTYAVAWLALAIVVLAIARWLNDPVVLITGAAIAMIGILMAIAGVVIGVNPLWFDDGVGAWPVLNGLLYLYGLPAALMVALIYLLRRTELRPLIHMCATAALVLLFVLVSLEVRQAFHGSVLSWEGAEISHREWYAYSLAWVLFGGLLLVLGIVLKNSALRYASLAVMLLAVGKVFLFDTAHLRDLYRVMSYLGLGLTLIMLGYLYQRFVFSRPQPEAGP